MYCELEIIGTLTIVLCIYCAPFSEGPLSEVLLYKCPRSLTGVEALGDGGGINEVASAQAARDVLVDVSHLHCVLHQVHMGGQCNIILQGVHEPPKEHQTSKDML